MAARIGHGNLELHEVAGGRRDLRPVHLQGGDARGQRLPQCAAHRGDRDLLDGAACAAAARRRCSSRRRCLGSPWSGSRPRSAIASAGMRLALLAGGAFLYLAVFGQWASAMTTLASIAIAVPLGVAGGVLFGILGYRVPLARRIMEPILDLMQTVPIFAYLIPILFLFGFGPVAALIATMIYAMPPMVRVTMTALEAVPREIVEYGTMAGTTRRQMLFKVMLPAARPQLLVGVNQVIMLSLNMVIIASMIGAGGLGYDVLTALRRLDIGARSRGGACHRRARHRARPVEPGLCVAAGGRARSQDRALRHRPSRVHRRRLCPRAVRSGGRDLSRRRCSFPPRRGGARRSGGSTCISSTRWMRSRARSCSTC